MTPAPSVASSTRPARVPGPVTWGQVARRPRMLGVLAGLMALAALFGSLGAWQLDRAYSRGAAAHERELAQREATEAAQGAAGLGTVLPPQATFTNAMVGRLVHVTGTYEPGGQLLVPQRALDGRVGYLVLTPLRVSDDGTGGASWAGLSGAPVVPVVRGWVATPDAAPAAPVASAVQVTGWLQASEATNDADLPAGQIDSVSSAALANRWGGPIYGGYVVLSSSTPAADPSVALLPRPVAEGSGSVNLQSLSYAFQWWLFAGFAFFVWWRVVRDQRDHENAALAVEAAASGEPDEAPTDGTRGPRTGARGDDGGIAGLPALR